MGVLGRYPVHFHMIHDAVGEGMYAKDNSIHDVFQRCVVIHGTDGVLVKDNVAFNTNGHCYFLEDGCEMYNTFDHNLGINAHGVGDWEDPRQIIPTDSSPSMFWITNPMNTWTNNAAVCPLLSMKVDKYRCLPSLDIGFLCQIKLLDCLLLSM